MGNKQETNNKAPLEIQLSGCRSHEADSEDRTEERGQWASQIEYILSVVGFCVGPGNVWRFPYICSRNGGGIGSACCAFLIPFILCLVLCGLPLFFLEVAIGQFSARSPVHVWSLCPLMKGIGLGMLIIGGGIPAYFTTVCAWSLYYMVYTCTDVLPWTTCNNTWNTDQCVSSLKILKEDEFPGILNTTTTVAFNQTATNAATTYPKNASYINKGSNDRTLSNMASEEFWQHKALSLSKGLEDIGNIKWELAVCLLCSWILIMLCVIKGVKSLGKAVYITATLPYFILIVLLVRGLTLPGGPSGALYYITPDFSKLLVAQVWVEAFLQMFYSLGPSWGGLIVMASYNKFNTNCLRNSIVLTFMAEGTSLFAGLVVFSILGFMAQEANVPIDSILNSGPGLGFVTYPEALAQLPLPQFWSFIFFIMLIMLAIDFLFGGVETVLTTIMDEFPVLLRWRVPVVVCFCMVSFLLSLVLTTEGGMYIFQLVDWYILSIFPIFAGILECVTLGWIYGIKRFSDDIGMMLGRPAPLFFKLTWCYVTPIILTIMFIVTLSQYQLPTYDDYSYPGYTSIIGWCIAFLPVMPIFSSMALAIYREEGSFLQRIRQSLEPEDSWAPSEISSRTDYKEKHRTRISIKDTFFYSVSCKS